jgi:hypothetical protein
LTTYWASLTTAQQLRNLSFLWPDTEAAPLRAVQFNVQGNASATKGWLPVFSPELPSPAFKRFWVKAKVNLAVIFV